MVGKRLLFPLPRHRIATLRLDALGRVGRFDPLPISGMTWFKWRSRSFNISECDPTYKVKYLGNVLTTFVRGEGCVDRPLTMIWNNYRANPAASLDMQLIVMNSGLRVVTKPPKVPNQPSVTGQECVTEYRCHRISYVLHHPQFPQLFVWVYRHEGRKMKIEARCHAVLCKSEAKAKAIYEQLRKRMSFALAEFAREKTRRQNSRLVIQRTRSVPAGVGGIALPVRTQHLRQGQHFKPPSSVSNHAPHLGSISEELSEPEPSYCAGPSRLTWQRLQPEEEKSDAACGKEGQKQRELSACADEQRNSGDGGDDDDDESVFLSEPPFSFDFSLSDIIESFAQNGIDGDEDPFRSAEYVCSCPSVNPCPDPPVIRCSEAVSHSQAVLKGRCPGHLCPLFEKDIDGCAMAWERTDPEGMEASNVPDFDDQSTESGFSEQDAHDL